MSDDQAGLISEKSYRQIKFYRRKMSSNIQSTKSRDWCKKKRTGLDLAMKMDAFSIL